MRGRCPGANVRFELVDLASLASATDLAKRMLAAGRPIDILVNNARVMALRNRELTADGFEMQFGTNYLSHFALTAKLLPLLIAGKARVVQLSSIAHRSGIIQLDDLNYRTGYKPVPVYCQSKLAMLMFVLELDRQSLDNGWGLSSVAAHPGIARSDLVANEPAAGANPLKRSLMNFAIGMIGQSTAAGALPTLMAATMKSVSGGQYFGPQGWKEFKGPPGTGAIDARALDRHVAGKLWAASEQLTAVSFKTPY